MNMSSIEWLVEQVNSDCLNSTFIRPELIQQAKAMHKEEIEDAWLSAWKDSMLNPLEDKYYQPEAEQYYNETFNK